MQTVSEKKDHGNCGTWLDNVGDTIGIGVWPSQRPEAKEDVAPTDVFL